MGRRSRGSSFMSSGGRTGEKWRLGCSKKHWSVETEVRLWFGVVKMKMVGGRG